MAIQIRLRIEGPNQPVRYLNVPLGRTLVGRDQGCDLVLYNDSVVSRTHAKLDFDGEKCIFTHLASDNRSTLTDTEGIATTVINPVVVEQGNIFGIGQHKLFVESFIDDETASRESTPIYSDRLYREQSVFVAPTQRTPAYEAEIPPGLKLSSMRLLQMLPEIYQPEKPFVVNKNNQNAVILYRQIPFLSRFLALFESVLLPLEWLTDHFDFYLDVQTTPDEFLVWLESWFGLPFDSTWTIEKRRTLLAGAHKLYAMRGTRWALEEVLTIYLGVKPAIDENRKVNTVQIQLPISENSVQREKLEKMIAHFIPAHAQFELAFLEISL